MKETLRSASMKSKRPRHLQDTAAPQVIEQDQCCFVPFIFGSAVIRSEVLALLTVFWCRDHFG